MRCSGIRFAAVGHPVCRGGVFIACRAARRRRSRSRRRFHRRHVRRQSRRGLCGTPAPSDTYGPSPSSTPPGPGPFVTQAQPGTCTLRAAIEEANASAGHDTIVFTHRLHRFLRGPLADLSRSLRSPLALLCRQLRINVTMEGPTPPETIVLSGAGAGEANGLILQARYSAIRRLVINGFSGAGILIAGGGSERDRRQPHRHGRERCSRRARTA